MKVTDNATIKKVSLFIESHGLLQPGQRCLAALSGGADSIAMTLILKQLGYSVEAVHCNFHLRGDESKRDELFVQDFCRDQGIELHRAHFDTRTYAQLHGISIEMAARELRYGYFRRLLNDTNITTLCVAHHRDDNVETMLINLIRGTGIHGLVGIRPLNNYVVRPLLCLDRHEIEIFLQQQKQSFVIDSTNLVADVMRNKIRLNLLPMLKDINPSVVESLQHTAEQMAQAEKVYDEYVRFSIEKLVENDTMCINELRACASPDIILYEWLRTYGFSPATIRQLSQHLDANTGTSWSSQTHEIAIDRGRLIVESKPVSELPVMKIPEEGNYIYQSDSKFVITVSSDLQILRDRNHACLDASKVTFPLTIRPTKEGDRFVPLGMKGSRLLSDFLTDQKLSVFERRRQLVVTDASNTIIWVVGHRPDQRFCITENTLQRLLIGFCKKREWS